MELTLNKKWVRSVGLALLAIFVLLGIMRACFFSGGRPAKSYYLIARNIHWDSFNFSGKEPNIQAFAEDLVLAASKEANLHVQFVQANPQNLLVDLQAEKYDAVFTFMTPNSINEDIYYFSDPLYVLGSVLLVKEDSDVENLEDMGGKTIGIKSGSSSIYEVDHYPSIIIVTYDNMNAAMNDLVNGKIDGVIMDVWHALISTHGFFASQLKIATIPFTRQGLRLVALTGSDTEEFIKSFNDGLERVKASGEYQKLILKWDLYSVK